MGQGSACRGCLRTRRLAEALAEFRDILRSASAAFPPGGGARVLSGIDGAPIVSAETGLDKLAAQISQTAQWESWLQACLAARATAFLGRGPGHALSAMVRGIRPDPPAHALDDFRSVVGVRIWLRVGSPMRNALQLPPASNRRVGCKKRGAVLLVREDGPNARRPGRRGASRDLGSQSLTSPASPIGREKYFTKQGLFLISHHSRKRIRQKVRYGLAPRSWIVASRRG